MGRRLVDLRTQRPILDIASHGRKGPGHHRALTRDELACVSRTVRRVPEVMIRVTGGAHTARGVRTHLDYIETHADLETDDGVVHDEKGLGGVLLEDWDLDLEGKRRHSQRGIAAGRKPGKLVHNLIFSMPAGTPAKKVHQAVKKFALEKFALQHRYAMALHTHQGNPHVHVVVKAVSEQGERLNIRKATLREWRQDFARYLREVGVEANATERAVRGGHHQQRKNGVFWAHERKEAYVLRGREESVRQQLRTGKLSNEAGKTRLIQTREAVKQGWLGLAERLWQEGDQDLAQNVRRYVSEMPPARTDREHIAVELIARAHANRSQAPPSLIP